MGVKRRENDFYSHFPFVTRVSGRDDCTSFYGCIAERNWREIRFAELHFTFE